MSYKQTDRDLIIELAYTVAKLERKVERLEESLGETDGKAEMLIDDVVMLDERTQERAIATNPVNTRTIDFIQRSFE